MALQHEKVDVLIEDGIIITMDENRRIFRGFVAIKNDRIIDIGKTKDQKTKYKAKKLINATHKAVMPGFIDMHNHFSKSLTIGLPITEGLKIDEVLKEVWKMEENADKKQYYAAALLRSLESIKSGITCVVDHCFPFHKPGLDEQSLRAFNKVGIRGILARGIMTKPYEPISETKEQAFKRCVNLIEKHREEKWKIMVAPVSFRQATPDDYREARKIADKYKVRLYTHVSETPQEVQEIKDKYGKTPIALLHELGFTGPDVILVHVVYPTEEEIKILKDTNTKVVDCPSCRMKLVKGMAPVPKMLNAGITVALGIDLFRDMFTEIRNEILPQNLFNMDPKAIRPNQVFEMATINGANALGLGDQLGSLERGKKADITILDLNKPHLTPLINLLYSLVYSAKSSDVDTVLVDGNVIMENREIKTVDENKVMEMAIEASDEYIKRNEKLNLVEKYY